MADIVLKKAIKIILKKTTFQLIIKREPIIKVPKIIFPRRIKKLQNAVDVCETFSKVTLIIAEEFLLV